MFELKNFFVKKDGITLIENLNCKFFSSAINFIKCKSCEQKNAFIQSLIGNPQYETSGKILWDSKWKIEDKKMNKRCLEKFYWLSDFSPKLDSIKTKNFLFAMSPKTDYVSLFKSFNLEERIMDEIVYNNWTDEEKQKFKLIEIFVLKPKNIFFDLENPFDFVWQSLSNLRKKNSLSIFIFSGRNTLPKYLKIESKIIL